MISTSPSVRVICHVGHGGDEGEVELALEAPG